MSLTNSPIWFGSSAAGGGFYDYQINDSLRFNDDDSAYLNRTPSSASNRKTWTWSGWVKRGNIKSAWTTLFASASGSQYTNIGIKGSGADQLRIVQDNGAGGVYELLSSGVLRDTSAWYHIVVAMDTTQATSSNRIKVYINGEQQSVTGSYPSQNLDTWINNTQTHYLGGWPAVSEFLDGYFSEVNFIDGQALAPTSFGETKNSIWIPKAYSGSYGTNGFKLNFSNNSIASNLGLDSSGNGNNFSVNNIATTDQMIDTPTNNFAVLNSVATGDYFSSGQTSFTLSEGNLKYGSSGRNAFGTMAVSNGKWYFEWINTNNTVAAVALGGLVTVDERGSVYGAYYNRNGNKGLGLLNSGATETAYGATWTDNDVIGVAVDMDAATPTVTFYKNGSSQGAISVSSFVNKTVMPWIQNGANTNNMTGIFNFGQDSTFAGATSAGGNTDSNGVGDFKYSVPSGYLALCNKNLPEPVVGPLGDSIATDNFNPVLFTGNGSTQSITGVGFQPDFTWIKMRTDAGRGHALFNAVIGGNERLDTSSAQEGRTNEGNISFQSDGFNVTSSHPTVNDSGDSAVAWNWKANNTSGSSNSDGSITSTVAVNTDAKFSIISYTGNGSAGATIGHGLGVAPNFVITKVRSNGGYGWWIYHSSVSNGYLNLPSSLGLQTGDAPIVYGNNSVVVNPNSSVVTVGNYAGINQSGQTFIQYCFAEVDGYSKFGSYTGNGSSDGTFIYTGFKPAFVIVKTYSANGFNWTMYDSTRNTYNAVDRLLYPNLTLDENSGTARFDFLSNGFKSRESGNDNVNNNGYVYMAFAEQPFKYANAR